MEHTTQPEPLIRATELARYLKCAKSTVYYLAGSGQIPIVKIGRTGVRFDLPAVMAALQRPACSTSEAAK